MKRILVLGAGGMAGHVVALFLKESGLEVDTLSATNPLNEQTTLLDVTKINDLVTYLDNEEYDVVINCIGLLVKASEERKDLAVFLNSYLPHFLEDHYKDTKTKLIHLSTDCVFSGKNPPYKENSLYDGDLFYDRAKALGEVINDKDLTFRMSIIGPEIRENGTGLFHWFMNQTGEIQGYKNTIWNGVTTIELAKAIKAAIEQNITGLYHLVPDDNISKYNLLILFKKVFNKRDIKIEGIDGTNLDKTLVNTRKDFIFKILTYPDMIEEMKDWMDKHKELYRHYL